MYYKIIIYEKQVIQVATKNGIRKKAYFKKIATKNNIPKNELSKKHIETFNEYMQVIDGWSLVIDDLREDEDEKDTLIYKNNEKVKKLVGDLVYKIG